MTHDIRSLVTLLFLLLGLFASLLFVPFPGSRGEVSEVVSGKSDVLNIIYPSVDENVPAAFGIQGDAQRHWLDTHTISAIVYDEFGTFLIETTLNELEGMDLGGRLGVGGVVELGEYRGGAAISLYAVDAADGSVSEVMSPIPIVVVDGLEEDENDTEEIVTR